MFGRLGGHLFNVKGIGFRRNVLVLAGLGVPLMLCGCITERISLDLGIPLAYRFGSPRADGGQMTP